MIGGCSALPGADEDSRIVQITELSVSDLHDRAHRFGILIADAETDQVVFWETYRARALTDRDDDGYPEADDTVWDRPVDSPGDYILHARAERDVPPNDDRWESARLATGGDCPAIEVEIDREGFLSIEYEVTSSPP